MTSFTGMQINTRIQFPVILFPIFIVVSVLPVMAEGDPAFNGIWVINEELSDDTDKQVEVAIKEAGGKIRRGGKKGKGRYRGGPEDQAIYDHLAYDELLYIHYSGPEFRFRYEGGFERKFYSDGRGRVSSAKDFGRQGQQDYSFASWEGSKLYVEARPRDGGWISEVYSLQENGGQLVVEMRLKPSTFGVAVNIIRVYNRRDSSTTNDQ